MKQLILFLMLLPVMGFLGCGGGAPSPPPAAPPPPEQQDAGVVAARDSERLRRRMAASNTILTGPQGLSTSASTMTKTLLGQ